MEKITVLQGQTLIDLAIRYYGSAEGAFALAVKNGLAVTDDLRPGQIIEYDPAEVINSAMVDYWRKQNMESASGINTTDDKFEEQFSIIFE